MSASCGMWFIVLEKKFKIYSLTSAIQAKNTDGKKSVFLR
jgi:hypothetical protein